MREVKEKAKEGAYPRHERFILVALHRQPSNPSQHLKEKKKQTKKEPTFFAAEAEAEVRRLCKPNLNIPLDHQNNFFFF